ncbi:hypothetical protein DENSPDRAFT_836836 [Dentipellis sp. KUC8613]|nr:hypothetical protein DENSPDRAFT_836836 [Dentipellis sp. KUC8613]
MADPVAAKSGFLCMYMSNHPDTLVSYVTYFGKVQGHVATAKMESIDTKGMTLSYQTKAEPSSKKTVVVSFDPPLLGYEEVKPRLLAMKADADEQLGTVKAPQISSFRLPTAVVQTAIPFAFFIYTMISPEDDPSPVWTLGRFLRSAIGGYKTIYGICAFIGLTHSLEALYGVYLARKHRMPFSVTVAYISAILMVGFPVTLDLRRRIQQARIDSIMKGQ